MDHDDGDSYRDNDPQSGFFFKFTEVLVTFTLTLLIVELAFLPVGLSLQEWAIGWFKFIKAHSVLILKGIDYSIIFFLFPYLVTEPYRNRNRPHLPVWQLVKMDHMCEWQYDWDDRTNYLENRMFSLQPVDGDWGGYRRELWQHIWDNGSVLGVWEPLSLLVKFAQNEYQRWKRERAGQDRHPRATENIYGNEGLTLTPASITRVSTYLHAANAVLLVLAARGVVEYFWTRAAANHAEAAANHAAKVAAKVAGYAAKGFFDKDDVYDDAVVVTAGDTTIPRLPSYPLGGSFKTRVGTLLGALLWAVHPQRAEVVGWCSCQPYALSMLFVLCSTLCFLESQKDRTSAPPQPPAEAAAALADNAAEAQESTTTTTTAPTNAKGRGGKGSSKKASSSLAKAVVPAKATTPNTKTHINANTKTNASATTRTTSLGARVASWTWYVLSLATYGAALLSKAASVPLAGVFLLLLLSGKHRGAEGGAASASAMSSSPSSSSSSSSAKSWAGRLGGLVRPLATVAPFLGLAAALAVAAMGSNSDVAPPFEMPLSPPYQVLRAGHAFAYYFMASHKPAMCAPIYPFPEPLPDTLLLPGMAVPSYLSLLVTLAAVAWYARRALGFGGSGVRKQKQQQLQPVGGGDGSGSGSGSSDEEFMIGMHARRLTAGAMVATWGALVLFVLPTVMPISHGFPTVVADRYSYIPSAVLLPLSITGLLHLVDWPLVSLARLRLPRALVERAFGAAPPTPKASNTAGRRRYVPIEKCAVPKVGGRTATVGGVATESTEYKMPVIPRRSKRRNDYQDDDDSWYTPQPKQVSGVAKTVSLFARGLRLVLGGLLLVGVYRGWKHSVALSARQMSMWCSQDLLWDRMFLQMRRHPTYLGYQKLQAEAFFEEGQRYAKAIPSYALDMLRSAARQYPPHPKAHVLIGALLSEEAKTQWLVRLEAIASLQKGVQNTPEDFAAWRLLGELQGLANDHAGAAASFEMAIAALRRRFPGGDHPDIAANEASLAAARASKRAQDRKTRQENEAARAAKEKAKNSNKPKNKKKRGHAEQDGGGSKKQRKARKNR